MVMLKMGKQRNLNRQAKEMTEVFQEAQLR